MELAIYFLILFFILHSLGFILGISLVTVWIIQNQIKNPRILQSPQYQFYRIWEFMIILTFLKNESIERIIKHFRNL